MGIICCAYGGFKGDVVLPPVEGLPARLQAHIDATNPTVKQKSALVTLYNSLLPFEDNLIAVFPIVGDLFSKFTRNLWNPALYSQGITHALTSANMLDGYSPGALSFTSPEQSFITKVNAYATFNANNANNADRFGVSFSCQGTAPAILHRAENGDDFSDFVYRPGQNFAWLSEDHVLGPENGSFFFNGTQTIQRIGSASVEIRSTNTATQLIAQPIIDASLINAITPGSSIELVGNGLDQAFVSALALHRGLTGAQVDQLNAILQIFSNSKLN